MTDLILLCLKLFATFFKIGLFTFGGGYAMLPMMREEVLANNWATESDLVFATLGVVLPSFIIIIIVAKCYEKFQSSKIVKGCMSGLKPAVVGLIGAAAISIAVTVLFPHGISREVFSGFNIYISLAIFALMALLAFKKVHPILIICLSAVIGIAAGYGFELEL